MDFCRVGFFVAFLICFYGKTLEFSRISLLLRTWMRRFSCDLCGFCKSCSGFLAKERSELNIHCRFSPTKKSTRSLWGVPFNSRAQKAFKS